MPSANHKLHEPEVTPAISSLCLAQRDSIKQRFTPDTKMINNLHVQ